MNLKSTWTPFQSPEIKEICEHLTPEEKKFFMRRSVRTGVLGFLYSFVILFTLFYTWMTFPDYRLWVYCIGAISCLGWLWSRWDEFHEQKMLLCATEWAKSRGYRPDTLRTRSFSWCKPQHS